MSLQFERLEDRLLLAVVGAVKGSTLFITSDNSSDTVLITGGETQGSLTVVLSGGIPQDVTGVKNIRISMSGGDDSVELVDVSVSGNVLIDLGDGNDELTIGGSGTHIGGNLSLWAGGGGDSVTIDATGASGGAAGAISIGKNLLVDLGDATSSQNDQLTIVGANSGETISIGGNATIKGQAETQSIQIDSTSIGKAFKVDLGDGDDVLNLGLVNNSALSVQVGKAASIKTGAGDDTVSILGGTGGTFQVGTNLTIDLGADDGSSGNGDDRLTMRADTSGTEQILIGGNFSVKGSGGVQIVELDGVQIGKNAKIALGAGDDDLDIGQAGGTVLGTVAGNLAVDLGDGDDFFRVASLTVNKKFTGNGGRGSNDTGIETNPGTFTTTGSRKVTGFEAGNLSN